MTEETSLPTVEVSQTPLDKFEEYLRARAMRVTKPRRVIVEEVFRRHSHFDADELLAAFQPLARDQRPSRPTVYRTLKELVDAGLLREMSLGGRRVYEHDYGYPQHDHLHCEKCDRLIEFSNEEIKRIREAVAREHQFRVTGHRLIISGVCSACAAAMRRKRQHMDML